MKNEIKRTGTARKVGRPRAYTPEALKPSLRNTSNG